jgi:hypothetical protein
VFSQGQMQRPFQLRCDAGPAGAFAANADRVSVTLSQQLPRNGDSQMWDCILLVAKREADGTLKTQVLLCNPEWDEPMEVANIECRPMEK